MADLTKFLSLSGLQRYDSKIKAFIADKVASHLLFEIVETVIVDGVELKGIELLNNKVQNPKDNIIYLVPNKGESQNVKDEYMYINGAWELIGTTSVDLSGYYTKVDADAKFETIVNVDAVRGRVSTLESKVSVLEAIDHDAYKEADTALETAYKAADEAVKTWANGEFSKIGHKHEIADVNGLQDALDAKAKQADLTAEVKAREELAGVVANKAAQSDLTAEVKAREALAERVTTAEGEIDALQEAVAKKADADGVYTKGEVDTLIDSINTSASTLEGRVDANEGAITALQGAVATKAAQSDLEALQGTVNGMYTNAQIDEKVAGEVATINAEIAKKAAQSDLTAEVQAREALAGVVDTKAAQADLTAEVQAREALASNVYTKSEVYTKAEVEAMVISDAEIDALFTATV